MDTRLDVLLLEDRSESGAAEQVLVEAGHRVHRCRSEGDEGFACAGMTGERRCPLDGPIDLALLVRNGPSATIADGARCAIRRGVPVVEQGSDAPDPLAEWITYHVRPGESIVSGCLHAAELAKNPLRDAISQRIRPVLDAAGVEPDAVGTELERDGEATVVHLFLPGETEPRLEQALAVRVLDAVRAAGRTYGAVGVQVHPGLRETQEGAT